jgi:hypothetical protein
MKRKRRKVTLKADSLLGAKLEDFSQPRSIMSERFPKVFALWPKSIANTLHRRKMEIWNRFLGKQEASRRQELGRAVRGV